MPDVAEQRIFTLRHSTAPISREDHLAESFAPGLYVVATPIGNLGDLSPRALAVLDSASVIAAEDTRTALRLFDSRPAARFVALTEHNVEARAASLCEEARTAVVALISEAGTPVIADPGARLVAAAHEAGVTVVAVPGPSALAAALSVAGFEGAGATFMGFLPKKAGDRHAAIERAAGGAGLLVIFESPRRLAKTLLELDQWLGDPEVVVCRELTKMHEEVIRGRASELAGRFEAARGECTLVVAVPERERGDADLDDVRAYMGEMRRAGAQRSGAAGEAAKRFGVARQVAYEMWDANSAFLRGQIRARWAGRGPVIDFAGAHPRYLSVPERIFVGVAWPYANYFLHVGQAAGAYLPADIFARYHRLKGNDVLMVSGSDSHGTPITVSADREGVSPREIVDRYHAKIEETWERLGISFDLYTSTLTDNHYATVQETFRTLLEKDYLYTHTQDQLYDPEVGRFLPDRYVEGICPRCNYGEARGDQCDQCGATLDATDLIEPRSRFSGATPEVRASEHYFLRLSAFEDDLREWVGKQDHWRRNVRNFTLGTLDEGLKDRAITRDIAWGVPVPVDGYEQKRIYVWFDAVIGYLSASKQWAEESGDPSAWEPYWKSEDTRAYYFIGKDNIVFHTVIWPSMLLGRGDLNLPYDVPANQYVNFSAGQKQSKSKGTGTWVLDLLDLYDPDVVRFYLAAIMPETADTEFREEEMIRTNNDVLIGTWGNLANRVVSMIHRNYEGMVPAHGPLSPESAALLAEAQAAFDTVGQAYADCHFRTALQEALRVAQAANKYLDERAPWKAVKEDRAHAAETLTTALNAIGALATLLNPVVPFSTARLMDGLGFPGWHTHGDWSFREIAAGAQLGSPGALYTKLDVEPVEAAP